AAKNRGGATVRTRVCRLDDRQDKPSGMRSRRRLEMKRKITLLIGAAAVAGVVLAAAAFGDASSASSSPASKGAVVALRQTTLGRVLVDSRGRTLYLFGKDKHGRSACYGTCATYWPPLLSTAKPRAGRGVRASLLGC